MSETPAIEDQRLSGIAFTVHRHGRVGSLEEAARLRGVEPSAVIKTMVVRRGDDDYVFVLVPGDRVIDWPKLRDHLNQRRLSMPDADEALAVTGYIRGTITPFAASHDWPVVADSSIAGHDVSVGGGAPGVSLTIAGDDLIRAVGAAVSDITKLQ